jgi:hypothetical protein
MEFLMSDNLGHCDIVRFTSIADDLISRINAKIDDPGDFLEWVNWTRAKFPNGNAAVCRPGVVIDGDQSLDWGPAVDNVKICALVALHDLTISGALSNANLDDGPLLFVDGKLTAQRIEHGGARTLILGDIETRGPVLCEYNHGVVRVGGNMTAEALIVLDQDAHVAATIDALVLNWDDGGLREHADVFDDPNSNLPSGDFIRARLAQRLPILKTPHQTKQ